MAATTTQLEQLTDLAARIRTFTLLNWCGLPYNVRNFHNNGLQLNPRKMAKIGFVNSDRKSVV